MPHGLLRSVQCREWCVESAWILIIAGWRHEESISILDFRMGKLAQYVFWIDMCRAGGNCSGNLEEFASLHLNKLDEPNPTPVQLQVKGRRHNTGGFLLRKLVDSRIAR